MMASSGHGLFSFWVTMGGALLLLLLSSDVIDLLSRDPVLGSLRFLSIVLSLCADVPLLCARTVKLRAGTGDEAGEGLQRVQALGASMYALTTTAWLI